MDIPTILSGTSLLSSAISTLKNARELAKETADSELKDKISDVYDVLLDLKERMHSQDDEIRHLKSQLAAKASYAGPIAPHGYYFFNEDAEHEVNPLCPICFQAATQQISFMSAPEDWSNGVRRVCKANRSHIIWEREKELSQPSRRVISHNPYA